jgi:hypothetical protein
MALAGDSPALNVGDSSVTGSPYNLAADQRGPGFNRVSGTGIDLGAFELQAGSATDVTSQVQVSQSGLLGNRRGGTMSGTIGLTNVGNAAVAGGLVFVWQGLTAGVSVKSVSVTINGQTTQLTVGSDGSGNPEVVISSQLLASFAAGQSITLNVVYNDPNFAAVGFVADLLSDPTK